MACVMETTTTTATYMKMVTPRLVLVKSPLARISPTMLMAEAGERLVRTAPTSSATAQRSTRSLESASITRQSAAAPPRSAPHPST